ncbi:MAG: right-handed parallel beta-helix repeat-containing protein [Gemmatimonadales bacterium]|nr:right-handed parallel beta-helix repeat-containing protein [Gemmatimonadales bacterium]
MILEAFSLVFSLLAGPHVAAPCIRPSRAGTQVQGDVRVCPGRYRIPDSNERGVIIAAASGTRVDLTGVVLESGDSVPGRYAGIGVASRGVDGVTITGGTIRGYRHGVKIEGGRNHRISSINLSGSRNQEVRSTPARPDSADRLDLIRREAVERYGGGILLLRSAAASVTDITARGAQNGIGLVEVRDSYIAENNVGSNSGWGIHLWRSAGNTIVRNRADRTRRCESQVPASDCGAAAILLRDASDSNTIVDNDLTASSSGFRLAGARPQLQQSVGNLVHRNDASAALGTAFSAAYGWSNTFLENRADSAGIGFRLNHSGGSTLRGNTVIGSRSVGILSDHGSDNAILANVLIGGVVGIRIGAPNEPGDPSRRYRVDDNVLARLERGVVLEQTTRAQLRGNLFDGVGDGLVLDGAGHASEVTGNIFLRASRWFIEAPDLAAGGNYWATADASSATAKVKGRISIMPWKPATAAGY